MLLVSICCNGLFVFQTSYLHARKRIFDWSQSRCSYFSRDVISFTFSIASLVLAQPIFDNSINNNDDIDWNNLDDSANLAISEPNLFDNHEADPSLNFNLFSDAGSVTVADKCQIN